MKRAIVIGASSGIGKALTILLAGQNFKIGASGRRSELLTELEQRSPNVIAYPFDCTDGQVPDHLDRLTQKLQGLDLLVISAGTGHINETLEPKLEQDTNHLNVNAFTEIAIWAFRYFEQQGHGHLVGITSMAGLRGQRGAPAYNASKAYQINYLEGLRQKAKRSKQPIYVTDIRPGFVDTAMAKGDGQFWVASKEKAARQIWRHIRRKSDFAYVTKRWRVLAFVMKIIPNGLYKRL